MNTLFRTSMSLLGAIILYIGGYFLVMRPGIALDPTSKRAKFTSFYIFSRSVRVPGELTVLAPSTNFLNYIYCPLDTVFRRREIPRLERYNAALEASR